jgi:gluconokinase
MLVVVMGPAGSGKSTVGPLLAAVLGVPFTDGDDAHSDAAREQMARGVPLDDAARVPWLDRLHAALASHTATGLVLACSALTPAYRARLGGDLVDVRFVALDVPRAVLEHRLATRAGHFAGPALVESQLAALELDDDALVIDANQPVADVVAAVQSALRERHQA